MARITKKQLGVIIDWSDAIRIGIRTNVAIGIPKKAAIPKSNLLTFRLAFRTGNLVLVFVGISNGGIVSTRVPAVLPARILIAILSMRIR